MVANLRKMLCFQQSQEWYATLNPCHAQSDRWNPLTLLLSPAARIWIIFVSLFSRGLSRLWVTSAWTFSIRVRPHWYLTGANAFIPILIFFSTIAWKANSTLHDGLLYWSISLLVSPHLCGVCGLVVLVVGVSAWGKETVPPDSFLSVEHLIDLAAGLTWWCSGLLRNEPTWTSCCQAGHQETSGWGYSLL